MKLNNLFFAFFLLFSISAIAQNYTFTDGPYIIENRVIGVVDKNGEQRVLDTLFTSYSNIAFNVATNNGKELFILDNSFIKSIDYSINSSELGKRSEQLIFTISDSHGDINQFINLLTRNKIINKDLDWSFAKNTLVINGDTFDRGSDVLPLLWYIIKLEQQAKAAGGRLVYVLGNHDNMVLKGDLRYLADKYRSLQDSLGQPYNALFCKESIIGKWLASKNAVQKIGNLLFVHGGISYEFVKMGFTPEIANKIIRDNLFCEKSAYNSDAQFLFGSNGPLWYRGLVRDDEKYNPITSNQLKLILNNLKIKRIVVGHTTFDDIVNHHRGKIISVDSRDKNTGVPHLFQGYMTR